MAGVEIGTGLLLSATISIKITFSALPHYFFKVQTFDTVLFPAPQSTQPCNVPPCTSLAASSGLPDLSENNLGNKQLFISLPCKLRKLPGQQGISFNGERDWTRQARQRGIWGGGGGGGGMNMLVFSAVIREGQP